MGGTDFAGGRRGGGVRASRPGLVEWEVRSEK